MAPQISYYCRSARLFCMRGIMQFTFSALSGYTCHLIEVCVFSRYVQSSSAVAVQHIRQLQKSAESHSHEITAMNNSLQAILNELKTLSTIADSAQASVQFGTERKDTVAKMSKLVSRMHVLQQVCHPPLDKNLSATCCVNFGTPESKIPDHSTLLVFSSKCTPYISCIGFASRLKACCLAVWNLAATRMQDICSVRCELKRRNGHLTQKP